MFIVRNCMLLTIILQNVIFFHIWLDNFCMPSYLLKPILKKFRRCITKYGLEMYILLMKCKHKSLLQIRFWNMFTCTVKLLYYWCPNICELVPMYIEIPNSYLHGEIYFPPFYFPRLTILRLNEFICLKLSLF